MGRDGFEAVVAEVEGFEGEEFFDGGVDVLDVVFAQVELEELGHVLAKVGVEVGDFVAGKLEDFDCGVGGSG